MPMIQVHASLAEKELWESQSHKPEIGKYIAYRPEKSVYEIPSPFGYTTVQSCARLHVQRFCQAVADMVKSSHIYLGENFDFDHLKMDDKGISYKNISARSVVFCEGTGVKNNPYFSHIPVKGSWGDILRIQSELSKKDVIFKQKNWVIPDENGFLAGSNFFTEDSDAIEKSRQVNELFQNISSWFPATGIVEQFRAARPAMPDRRPVLGGHHQFHNLYIFNGLGTKGCSLSVKFAAEMAEFIIHKTPVNSEVDIRRFYQK